MSRTGFGATQAKTTLPMSRPVSKNSAQFCLIIIKAHVEFKTELWEHGAPKQWVSHALGPPRVPRWQPVERFVRPGGACGRLIGVKLPTKGSFFGENQAVSPGSLVEAGT